MQQKQRFQVDPHNRLKISASGERGELTRFRRALDGEFKAGLGNSLIYQVKAPMSGLDEESIAPYQVKLRGRWSLTENHDLRLTLDKWRRQTFGEQLTIQGELIQPQADALLFAVTTQNQQGHPLIYILKLEGSWQADAQNRLSFRVNRQQGQGDFLIFNGIWEVNQQQRIVYRYEKTTPGAKTKLKQALEFKGSWDVTKRNRLSYTLSRDSNSAFEFKTSLGRLSGKYIKYEIGIGATDKLKPQQQIVTLFGNWKINRNTGLLFEIDYEQRKPQAITFGAAVRLNKDSDLEFRLKNELGRDLGLKLALSRRLLKRDGQAFLKLLKSGKEVSITAGSGWRW